MVKTFGKSTNKKLTEHFQLKEMHCHGKGCCFSTKIDLKIVGLVEKMRVILDAPIQVESAYRCPEHNRAVGGANGSGHTYGTALDITCEKSDRARLATLAELVGVARIGIYMSDNKKKMVHIGTGKKLHWVNTGGYLPASHSFVPVPYAKPVGKVTPKSAKKYVAYVQACLFARGYDIKIDGDWGAKTQKAVDSFRKSKGWKKADYLKSKGIKELLK